MKGKKVTKKDSKMLSPGERLKKLRTDAGLTQEELAELIDNLPENNRTGRSRNQISYIENGSRSISADYAKLLSKVLHVLPEYLLGESNFRTLKEKRDALAEKDWEEKILTPIEIDSLVSKILEKMGYTEFEDDITGKEFLPGILKFLRDIHDTKIFLMKTLGNLLIIPIAISGHKYIVELSAKVTAKQNIF